MEGDEDGRSMDGERDAGDEVDGSGESGAEDGGLGGGREDGSENLDRVSEKPLYIV